jgi:hypothetical protein
LPSPDQKPGFDSIACLIYRGWPRLAFFFMNARGAPRFSFCGEGGSDCLTAAGGPWREMQEAAEAAYDRSSACRFTTFVGYEWTKSVEQASNLHRNVIFRNAAVPIARELGRCAHAGGSLGRARPRVPRKGARLRGS